MADSGAVRVHLDPETQLRLVALFRFPRSSLEFVPGMLFGSKVGRSWTGESDRFRPALADFVPTSPILAKSGPSSANVVNRDQTWVDIGQPMSARPDSGRARHKQIRPTSTDDGQNSTNAWAELEQLLPSSTGFGSMSAKFGPSSARVGQNRPNVGQKLGPNSPRLPPRQCRRFHRFEDFWRAAGDHFVEGPPGSEWPTPTPLHLAGTSTLGEVGFLDGSLQTGNAWVRPRGSAPALSGGCPSGATQLGATASFIALSARESSTLRIRVVWHLCRGFATVSWACSLCSSHSMRWVGHEVLATLNVQPCQLCSHRSATHPPQAVARRCMRPAQAL